MNQMSKLLWAGIASSFMGGVAWADISCQLTPGNSVITDGQTLQLAATCSGELSNIDLLMRVGDSPYASVLESALNLSSYDATQNSIVFTSPVNSAALGGANEVSFKVDGAPGPVTSNTAKVVIKPATGASVGATTGFASSVTAVPAECGTANNQTVPSLPSNGALCASGSKPALVVSGPASYSWSCLSVTGGAEANCYATRGISYTVTATAGPNGIISPSGDSTVTGGTTKAFTVTPNSTYSIESVTGCNGTLSGNTYTTGAISGDCRVSATFTSGTPTTYTVTAIAGVGGTINPSGPSAVTAGSTKTFTVTANPTYSIESVTGCGGTLSGSTFTTAAVNGACWVTASFASTGGGDTSSDPGVGRGLWVPAGMPNRTIADIGGTPNYPNLYLPGCINGGSTNNPYVGCAAQTSYTGPIAGSAGLHTFSFGTGKQLMLRYQAKPTAGISSGSIRIRNGGDGGNVGTSSSAGPYVRVWLSDSSTATYESVPDICKQRSYRTPLVLTGPGRCTITPNKVYYVGIEVESSIAKLLMVDQGEMGSDFIY